MIRGTILLALATIVVSGQQKTVTLATIEELWADPAFEVSDVLNAIDNAGLVVDFSQDNLTNVLKAAARGKRSPAEVAQVILRLLQDCGACRSRFWAPMTSSEVLAALKKGPAFARDELLARGASNLATSVFYVETLKQANAPPDMVAMVEDRLVMPVPEGFQPVKLDKAPNFNPLASEGKLIVHVGIHDEVTFLFRHNALFAKMNKSEDLANLGCTFTAFGPVNEHPAFSLTAIAENGQKPKNKKIPEVLIIGDPSGRPGLQFTLRDTKNGLHPFDFELKWAR